MSEHVLKERKDIPEAYQWDIASMYDSDEIWEKDLQEADTGASEFQRFQGHLGDSASVLADALIEQGRISQTAERVFVYARMKQDEDNRVAKQQEMLGKAMAMLSRISAAMSFVTPEIISLPEERILSFLAEEPRLAVYEHMLKTCLREKDHVLPAGEENLMAPLGQVLGSTDQIFTMLNNADLKFGSITDESGNTVQLTHGNYISFMRSHDRRVREEAYTNCYEAYKALNNTLAANYGYNVKTDVVTSRIRHYASPRAAALSGGNIPESVYDNLVKTVNDALPALHDYIAVRKQMLGVPELKMHDVYVPLIELPERTLSFDEAVSLAEKGLAPLGESYLKQFRQGIAERWIDIYENAGKTSGAYSFGSYDSKPFVLLNYDGHLEDVSTLIHEMGHSMNSFYTRSAQPYCYGDHSIFTAEVASTVNESLLMRYLLGHEEDPDMRAYILNMYIEAFRTTVFRQTMFAEFEEAAHRFELEGGSLTAAWLNETYDELNTRYFGPALTHDDLIQYEWSRIPHFYRSYYVYQYATGYSAATAITDRILTEGAKARDEYLEFLKCGTNDDPVELLKIAGVDMSSPEPVERAMKTFKGLVEEFKQLV